MALVGYSDSETSDVETTPAPPKAAKPASSKVVDPSAPRKIKVDLPSVAADNDKPEERPAKRVRTGGGLGGFNSFLPAPKRTAETAKKTGLGSGVSLKTSANAAFSRERVEPEPTSTEDSNTSPNDIDGTKHPEPAQSAPDVSEAQQKPAAEFKTVGNAMRFKPLSVANKKKKPVKKVMPSSSESPMAQSRQEEAPKAAAAPPPKPKVSLFGATEEATTPSQAHNNSAYEPLMDDTHPSADTTAPATDTFPHAHQPPSDPNSLATIASDLNLSAADRRRLFGRNTRGADAPAIAVANFNMDSEYAKNEQLRAAGETIEHRAVKALAPGKHSLQQLVNSANTQREALEDAWAEGKRNRGEAGNKYGWAK